MRSQLNLGRIAGIRIGLHYSWFIIAVLIVLSLSGHFHSANPSWRQPVVWSAAAVTAFLFFLTLLLHELAHSLVAKRRGLRVRSITLFALGGVSQIESEAQDAKSEFWVAIAGPVASVLIGYLCMFVAGHFAGSASRSEPQTPQLAVLLWLGYINVALALFNMIPGYPLDGGRVLRALVWWITGKADRATRAAAWVGELVAFLLILFGVFRFFVGANVGGLWLAFIGWFLLDAARNSYVQVELRADLRGRTVSDLMERDCDTVDGYLSLRDFVDQHLLHSASRCFPVLQNGSVTGVVSPNEIQRVAREDWGRTSLQGVMRPLSSLRAVPPQMPAVQALELMARENVKEMVVVADGKFQGIFSRGQVVRFLQIYAGTGAESAKLAA